jgi:hypothetical protein
MRRRVVQREKANSYNPSAIKENLEGCLTALKRRPS